MCKKTWVTTMCMECKKTKLGTNEMLTPCGRGCTNPSEGTQEVVSAYDRCAQCLDKQRGGNMDALRGYQKELDKGKVKRTGSRMGK